MEVQRKDRTYGMVVGSAIGDAYGLSAERLMGSNVRLTSPVDPPVLPELAGRWGERTQLLLFYIDYFTQLNEDAVAYYHGSSGSSSHDATLALCCVGAAALFCSTDYDGLLVTAANHGHLFNCNPVLTKLWAAIDGAYHGAPKVALLRYDTYANIDGIDAFTKEFLAVNDTSPDADTELFLSADAGPVAAVFAAMRVFSRASSYVEATRLAVNSTMAPGLIGVLVGQLSGCYYGLTDVPERWVAALHGKTHLRDSIRVLPYGVQSPSGGHSMPKEKGVKRCV